MLAQAVYVSLNHFSKISEGYHSPLQCCQSNRVCLYVIGIALMGASICISVHEKGAQIKLITLQVYSPAYERHSHRTMLR